MNATDERKSDWLISPDGLSLRNDGSREFNLALTCGLDPTPDYDAPFFAVKNLGFVRFRQHGSLLQIVVHPRNVEPPALHAALSAIRASSATSFLITYLAEDWRQETIGSARDASIRFLELCHTSPGDVSSHQLALHPASTSPARSH